tara:strand:- start:4236 stop:4487 length:252 start_codon:yes stop_codon:yes gene_type:complete
MTKQMQNGTKKKKKKAKAGDTPMIPLGSSGYRTLDEGDKKVAAARKALGIGKKYGGTIKKMKHGGGTCRGMGAAKKGGKYSQA